MYYWYYGSLALFQAGGEPSWADFRTRTGARIPTSGTVAGLFGIAIAVTAMLALMLGLFWLRWTTISEVAEIAP